MIEKRIYRDVRLSGDKWNVFYTEGNKRAKVKHYGELEYSMEFEVDSIDTLVDLLVDLSNEIESWKDTTR